MFRVLSKFVVKSTICAAQYALHAADEIKAGYNEGVAAKNDNPFAKPAAIVVADERNFVTAVREHDA